MNNVIQSENVSFDNKKIQSIFEKVESNGAFKVEQLIYYPYFYFEYRLENKSLAHPKGGLIGCTVDGVNKIGAIVDSYPRLENQTAPPNLIQEKLKPEDAEQIAEEFVFHAISRKMKVFSTPKIKITEREFFYRPYWIVEGDTDTKDKFMLAVDAVTGKYHPL